MKPPGHAVVSLGIGAIVWGVTKSPYSMLAAFLTGVLIDLDHLVEYYSWFVREERSKVWFFLHSYELAVPAFLAGYISGWDPVVLGSQRGLLGPRPYRSCRQPDETPGLPLHISSYQGVP